MTRKRTPLPPPVVAPLAAPGKSQRRWPILLVAVVFIVFGRLVVGDFTPYDDAMNLYLNRRLNPPSVSSVMEFWQEPLRGSFGLYVPLTYTVWGVLAGITFVPTPDEMNNHLDPHVFHAINVLIHALTCWAVFALLNRLLRRPAAAAFGAALFALHPLQVETVGWVSGLKDLLSGLFCIVAITSYVAAAQLNSATNSGLRNSGEMDRSSRRRARVRTCVGLIAFVAAMLSKPSAMVAPALVFAIDLWCMGRPMRKVVQAVIPWCFVALPLAVIARHVQDVAGVPNAPLWARPLVAGDALAFYLWKFATTWPLIFDYELDPAVILHRGWGWWAWIVPLTLGFLAWKGRRQRPLLWLAALLFIIPLLPNSGLATFQFIYYSVVADHYVYLAMLGPAVMLSWLMVRFPRRVVYFSAALWLCILGGRSIAQSGVWRDHFNLTSHAIRFNPNAFMAHGNLGFTYDDNAKRLLIDHKIPEAREAVERAIQEYERAAELRPDSMVSWVNLISIEMRIRDLPAARVAAKGLDAAVRATPLRAWPPAVYAYLDLATDPEIPLKEAVQYWNRAVGVGTRDPESLAAIRKAEQYLVRRAAHAASRPASSPATAPH